MSAMIYARHVELLRPHIADLRRNRPFQIAHLNLCLRAHDLLNESSVHDAAEALGIDVEHVWVADRIARELRYLTFDELLEYLLYVRGRAAVKITD